jgi:hypothetical protein
MAIKPHFPIRCRCFSARGPAHLARPARHCARDVFHCPRSPWPAPFPAPPPQPEPCPAGSQVLRGSPTAGDRSSGDYRLSVPPAARPQTTRTGSHRLSRFSCTKVPHMPWLLDRPGSADGSRSRRPRCCLPPPGQRGHPGYTFRGSITRPARAPVSASLRPLHLNRAACRFRHPQRNAGQLKVPMVLRTARVTSDHGRQRSPAA